MGNVVRWPVKLKHLGAKLDITKWCEFHGDHHHNTINYIALHLEVAELLKRGHLREFLTDKGKSTLTNKDRQVTQSPKTFLADAMCEVISSGSEVSAVNYSSANCHARVVANPRFQHLRPIHQRATNLTIEFMDNEAATLLNPHHDALVVTFQIANIIVKRILIDPDSSANIMFLEAFRVMKLEESSINYSPTLFVGFSSEQKYTLGEIALPIYAKGINQQTAFMILDASSPYNVILSQPWIHSMRAISSTFHQTIRFPTKWGIKEIKED
ncbi:uncharacterized protein LOC116120486 [Pistacia vera]|uniref:uncharacterized protein LOC116120486 n=1 Tax=Pistacia vera TaxID=55513 RepID=UPI001263E390|nr:uncharacterized protein LOC116120486 [Pistacia vera]